ncbi:tRNA pseudouridine(55) synthase TruB [Demequina aurantiaca]|uniref:tRNA pseudouridine(55) synthase TruB n=1 Tax=Demequina aurantiaca TaxID=676200 RepID=UPI0007838835|nr:tRNA pseudouridine(55) synthase TruB [Demequina aurantiaca]
MTRTPKPEPVPGIVVVDKPQGWTSHDVVGRMRRLAQTKKVGHAGTLDPMATGVLVIGIGKATKLLTYFVGHGKTYDATIRLGQSTVTDDAEGDVVETADTASVTDAQIADAVAGLTGDIQQRPSSVSAIKVDGQRAYKRVRDGEDVELPTRPVTVSRFDVLDVRRDGGVIDIDVGVDVSSGTYVRALARDLGDALGVGGHLTALRRTAVGDIPLSSGHSLEDLGALVDDGEPLPLLPLADAAASALPVVTIDASQARALGFGQAIEVAEPATASAGVVAPSGGEVAAITAAGTLAAILRPRRGKLAPVVVFETSSVEAGPLAAGE